MRTSWLAGMIFLWLSIVILSLLLDNAYIGGEEMSTLAVLTSADLMPSGGNWFIDLLNTVGGYIAALWRMVTLDYSMFTGDWIVVKIAYYVLSIPTGYSLIMSLRGTPST